MTKTLLTMAQAAAARLSWAKAGSTLSSLAIAAFVFTALVAKWSPVQAQDAEKKKGPTAQAKKTKTPVAPLTRAIPGAGKKLDAMALAKIIDQEIARSLAEAKVPVSPLADDAEFLRRLYLDVVGVIPPAEKVSAFLSSTDPAKRAKVIDEVLADSRFGTSLAEVWSGLMLPRESNNRRLDHAPLQKWLGDSFNKNMPLDKLVYELITSTGDQDKNGAVTYFIGNPTVDKMTDNVSRMFLGVQLQCAQCHNHPFTDYKQNEYWGMAAFFMKVKLTANPQQAAKKGVAPGIVETAAVKGKKAGLPESAKIVPAKFLQAEEPKIKSEEPSRPILAKWMTSPSNPFFAKAMVNRFWYQAFGRGLVNPVDDMHDENGPSHPELLAALTEQFKANEFDVKLLLKAIFNSEAYQRTSRPTGDNGLDNVYYSHRLVRVMSAEQLYDSLTAVVGKGNARERPATPTKKGPAQGGRENFLNFFRIDEGADPLEYQTGIPQALRLMNSAQANATSEGVNQAMQGAKGPAQVIENLYLRTLSRRPTQQETDRFTAYVAQGEARVQYGDILWALLNSSEFALNH